MENIKKKCSNKKHSEIDAISFCQNCRIYLCNKCQNLHLELFDYHETVNIKKNMELIFTGYCDEINHFNKLEYFCNDHNKLFCANCDWIAFVFCKSANLVFAISLLTSQQHCC